MRKRTIHKALTYGIISILLLILIISTPAERVIIKNETIESPISDNTIFTIIEGEGDIGGGNGGFFLATNFTYDGTGGNCIKITFVNKTYPFVSSIQVARIAVQQMFCHARPLPPASVLCYLHGITVYDVSYSYWG